MKLSVGLVRTGDLKPLPHASVNSIRWGYTGYRRNSTKYYTARVDGLATRD